MSALSPQDRARQALQRQNDPAHRAEVERAKDTVREALGGKPIAGPAKATRALSYALDNMFPVPGTQLRFGIDPILSFFPAVGSAMGAVFGTVILADAVRLRTPIPVLTRMLGNHIINWLFGLIPGVGPFLDAWWKSNARNVRLLDRTIRDREQVRKASVFYWGGIGLMALIALGVIIGTPVALLYLVDAWITSR